MSNLSWYNSFNLSSHFFPHCTMYWVIRSIGRTWIWFPACRSLYKLGSGSDSSYTASGGTCSVLPMASRSSSLAKIDNDSYEKYLMTCSKVYHQNVVKNNTYRPTIQYPGGEVQLQVIETGWQQRQNTFCYHLQSAAFLPYCSCRVLTVKFVYALHQNKYILILFLLFVHIYRYKPDSE